MMPTGFWGLRSLFSPPPPGAAGALLPLASVFGGDNEIRNSRTDIEGPGTETTTELSCSKLRGRLLTWKTTQSSALLPGKGSFRRHMVANWKLVVNETGEALAVCERSWRSPAKLRIKKDLLIGLGDIAHTAPSAGSGLPANEKDETRQQPLEKNASESGALLMAVVLTLSVILEKARRRNQNAAAAGGAAGGAAVIL